MGVEHVKLYRKIELDIHTDSPATFEVYTELPQWDVRLRYTVAVATGPGRLPVEVKLPGNVRGRYIRLKIYGGGVVRLFSCRVWAKVQGPAEPQAWQWFPVPVEITPEEYSAAAIPIRQTGDGFDTGTLPIRQTGDGFADAALPIRETPDGFSSAGLPFGETAPAFSWVDIPIDRVE